MKIVYLVGSLSSQSINRGLSKALVSVAPKDIELVEVPIADLPLFNRDMESDYPQAARDLKEAIESADGVILITPEHNRMYSAALANAIEWSSRPWGSMSLQNKPVATIGTSGSGVGTAAAQQHLRAMLGFFNVKLMGQPEAYVNAIQAGLTPEGEFDESARPVFEGFINSFVEFVQNSK